MTQTIYLNKENYICLKKMQYEYKLSWSAIIHTLSNTLQNTKCKHINNLHLKCLTEYLDDQKKDASTIKCSWIIKFPTMFEDTQIKRKLWYSNIAFLFLNNFNEPYKILEPTERQKLKNECIKALKKADDPNWDYNQEFRRQLKVKMRANKQIKKEYSI